jgi:hypothetical protein
MQWMLVLNSEYLWVLYSLYCSENNLAHGKTAALAHAEPFVTTDLIRFRSEFISFCSLMLLQEKFV